MLFSSKKIKYLGTHLTQEIKDISIRTSVYKTLLNMTQRNRKIHHAHRLEEMLLKYPYSSEQPRFNAIPIKLSKIFLAELEQRILKFVWNHKSLQKAEASLRLGYVMTWIYHQSVMYKFHCFRNPSCLTYSPLPPKPCFYCTQQIQRSCFYIQFKIFSNIFCDFFSDL